MSCMPPLDLDCEGPASEHTAICPSCGGECVHPGHPNGYVDEEEWYCLACDYVYPD